MPLLELGPNDGLYYEHDHPTETGAPTFVFVNPITGSVDIWQAEVAPALRDAGYGTLAYNFRGQADSSYQEGTVLNDQLISGDLSHLVNTLEIDQPIFVGLSIGGLFALQAHLSGVGATGMVLLNTLRTIGPRIAWINDAVVRTMEVGGPQLMGDIMTPLIWGPAWLSARVLRWVSQRGEERSNNERPRGIDVTPETSIPDSQVHEPVIATEGEL